VWNSLTPLPGSQKGLKRLVECGHDIYLATATHPNNFAWKVEWLKRYFPFIHPARIIRIVHKGLLKCDVMIDDSLGNLMESSCHRIAIDYPWNQDKRKSYVYDIHRAKNFSEVIDIINDIERKENEEWEM
jgi:5'(3')-deoxyribonucleotidase